MFTTKTGPTCPHCGSLVIPVRGCVNRCKEKTMKTAEQFVNEECAVYTPEALVTAVKARDRQLVEACEYEALLAGNPCGHDPCSHSTCTTARSAAARIRALIPGWKDVQGEGFWCTQAPHYDKDVAAKMLFSPAFDWGLPGACVECWEAGRRSMDDPDPADPTGAEPGTAQLVEAAPQDRGCNVHGRWTCEECQWVGGFPRELIEAGAGAYLGAKPGTGKL